MALDDAIDDLDTAQKIIKLLGQEVRTLEKERLEALASLEDWKTRALSAEVEREELLARPPMVVKVEDEKIPLNLSDMNNKIEQITKELGVLVLKRVWFYLCSVTSNVERNVLEERIALILKTSAEVEESRRRLENDLSRRNEKYAALKTKLKEQKENAKIHYGDMEKSLIRRQRDLEMSHATELAELRHLQKFNLQAFLEMPSISRETSDVHDLQPFHTNVPGNYTLSKEQIRICNNDYIVCTDNDVLWPKGSFDEVVLVTPANFYNPKRRNGLGDWEAVAIMDSNIKELFYIDGKTCRYPGSYKCSQTVEMSLPDLKNKQIESNVIKKTVAFPQEVPPVVNGSIPSLYRLNILKVHCHILKRVGTNEDLAADLDRYSNKSATNKNESRKRNAGGATRDSEKGAKRAKVQ